jgi:hypothetical protein
MKTTKTFYKENNVWYIDLPEFLNAGLGDRSNLMMVAGADTLLDKLSDNGDYISVTFADEPFDGYEDKLSFRKLGIDKDYLAEIGHAPVDGGAYYYAENNTHNLWLCPVTLYVFKNNDSYPENIYIKKSMINLRKN